MKMSHQTMMMNDHTSAFSLYLNSQTQGREREREKTDKGMGG